MKQHVIYRTALLMMIFIHHKIVAVIQTKRKQELN